VDLLSNQISQKVKVPCEFDRLQGKEFTNKLADVRVRPEVQAKDSQVNIGLSMCTF
jgi:hypothetical protein